MHAAGSEPSLDRQRRSWRGLAVCLSAAGLATAAATAGWWCFGPSPSPPPPLVNTERLDPQITAALKRAQSDVERASAAAAWGKLGALYFVHNFLEQADLCLAEAERLDPRDPRWPYLRARAIGAENPVAMLPPLRRAVELSDNTPPAPRLLLAEALLQRGELTEAEAHFRRILSSESVNERALLGLARVEAAQDRFAESLEHAERSARIAPRIKATQVLLAMLYGRLGDKAAAERSRRAADSLADLPVWPDPFLAEAEQLRVGKEADLRRAQGLLDKQRYPELVAFIGPMTRVYADDARSWQLLGLGYLHQQSYAQAESALRKAVGLAPESVDALVLLGMSIYHQNRFAEAEPYFHQALRIRPNHAEAYFDLGLALSRQHDWPATAEAFQNALRLKPDWTFAYIGLGDALLKQNKLAEAVDALQHALKLSPSDRMAQTLLEKAKQGLTATKSSP